MDTVGAIRRAPGLHNAFGSGRLRRAAVRVRRFSHAQWAASAAWIVVLSASASLAAADLDVPILITQLPAGSLDGAVVDADRGPLRLIGEGARILLVNPDGTQRVMTEGFHSAADPVVSFDAKRFAFAGKRAANDIWNIFECSLTDGQVRQITRDMGNCRRPSYQPQLFTLDSPEPWFQLTYVSDAAGWLNENGSGPVRSLYSCRLDGSEIRRLTYNLSDDLDPFQMGDGRILYTSWQHVARDEGVWGRMLLFAVNTEGTDNALFAEAAGERIKRMPCITDRGLVLFIESDGVTADGFGWMGSVTFRRPLKSYRAITTERDPYVYHAPSAWTQGRVLVSRRPADRSATAGIYLFDPKTGAAELLADDPGADEVEAVAVRPSRQPDGRSTVVDDSQPLGQLYCLSVSVHDLPDSSWLPAGTVKRLRVLEGIPLTVAEGDPHLAPSASGVWGATRNGLPPLAQRRLLGETDISPDGSFHISVPANTPIELQTLDERGLALRTCRWIWSKNAEPRGCIGCHEDGESTPENAFVDALKRPAVALTLPPERRRTVDFRRDLMPIIDAKCVGCHDQEGAQPRLDGGLAPASASSGFNRAYVNLLAPRDTAGTPTAGGRYVDPGRARTSPLVWHLFGTNTARPWDGQQVAMQPAKCIPPGKLPVLTNLEIRAFVEWVDLGAMWDGIPGSDQLTLASPTSESQTK